MSWELAEGHDWDMPGSDWQKCRHCGLQANLRVFLHPVVVHMAAMAKIQPGWRYLDFSGQYADESYEAKPCLATTPAEPEKESHDL